MKKTFSRIFNAITFLCISLICVIGLGFGLRASGVTGENFVTKLLSFAGTTAEDEYTKGPERSKTSLPNGDGSYKLTLTVKGESEVKVTKTNVIVVVDTSGSMDDSTGYVYSESTATNEHGMYGLVDGEYVELTRHGKKNNYTWTYGSNQSYTGTRYTREESKVKRMAAAKEAVNSLANSLLSLNGKDGNPTDTFEMALVSFATSSSVKVAKTTSYSTFSDAVNRLSANGGTNWEAALDEALGIDFGDSDKTYIIFVSDGNPTFHKTDGGYNNWNYTYSQYGTGKEGDVNVANCYTMALPKAQAIVSGGYEFYTVGAYGNVSRMAQLTTDAGADASHYFSAADTTQLQNALLQILNDIKMAGYGAVTINDGTTANVTTSTGVAKLLTVDEDSFEYYKGGSVWEDAPEAKLNKNGEVVWDLGPGVLDNGVEYKVTFNVWPSQYTLDLIADLKNGRVKYENIDANIKEYLSDKDYKLATNTVASISYNDTRTQDGPQTASFVNPPKVPTETYKLEVKKTWDNGVDDRIQSSVVGIKMHLFKDGNLTDNLYMSEFTTEWKASAEIAPGILKVNGDNVEVLEHGHDYSLGEPDGLTYHWELTSEVVHPMIIDGSMTILELNQDKAIATAMGSTGHKVIDGVDYYQFDGKIYKKGTNGAVLTATNHRRSVLEFTKTVTGEKAPADAKFDYTFNVVNVYADKYEGDKDIWFSICDTNKVDCSDPNKYEAIILDEGDTNAHPDYKTGTTEKNGYYYLESGKDITVKLKAGYNLRVINLPTGSTYTITETGMPNGFEYVSVTGDGTPTEDVEQSLSGSIDEYNKVYKVTFNNKYVLRDVVATKVWNDNKNQDGKRPESVQLQLYAGTVAEGEPVTVEGGMTEESWTYTFKGLHKFDTNGEEITYTVKELDSSLVNGYTKESESGLTVTNKRAIEKTSITVTKEWADDGNRDAVRPASVQFQLYAGDTAVGDPITLTGDMTADTWTYTINDLDVNANGSAITYTVKEVSATPDGYSKQESGLKVTNTHITKKVTRTVKKEWNDNNNQDGKRPDKVTVRLLADATQVGDAIELNDENKWTYTVTQLPMNKYVDGQAVAIRYTWSEDAVGNNYNLTGNDVDEKDNTKTILTNTRAIEYTSSTVKKVWNDDNNRDGIRPTSLKVYLNGTEYTLTSENAVENDPNTWTLTIPNLPVNKDGKPITYTWTEGSVGNYTPGEAVVNGTITTFTNSHDPAKQDITVKKVWHDANNQDRTRPGSVKFQLYAGTEKVGEPFDVTGDLTAAEWTYTYPVKQYVNANGEEITYSVKEVSELPTDYFLESESGLVVTNKHITQKTSVTVTKQWQDAFNQDRVRPESIFVKLMDGETVVDRYELTGATTGASWTYTWTGLEKNRNGQEIQYTVVEEAVEGYKPLPTVGDYKTGITLTNVYTPEVVTISGTKEWRDNNNQDGIRPGSVTVKLMVGDDYVTDSEGHDLVSVASADNDWTYSFTVDKKNNGVDIDYVVKELPVDGYITTYEGSTIVNTHATAVTEVSGTKTWRDDNNQDGLRPENISVKLKVGDEYVTDSEGKDLVASASEATNWAYTFGELPAKANGQTITYVVEEVQTGAVNNDAKTGYAITYDGYNVINTHTSAVTTIRTEKVWEDEKDNDKVRPDSITIRLSADGKEIDHQVVTANDKWSAVFENLPVKTGGRDIVYTITEDPVDGYETDVQGFKVTNTHELATRDFTVSKTWADADDQDGKRPESVSIKLYADGTEVEEKTVTLDEDNKWTYTWEGLQKYTNGELIQYTVVEEEMAPIVDKETGEETAKGYSASYAYTKDEETGNNKSVVVTNSYDPEKTSVTVTKSWADADDQDGIRPDSIEVELYANDDEEPIGTAELTEAEGWTFTFEELHAYRNGELITYSVKEVEVPEDYKDSVDGYVVINTHKPYTVDVNGTITWDDEDDEDEIRPDSVEICLYANGEKVECITVEPDENGDWTYEFPEQPKNENGEEITYTITEKDIDDYETEIKGYDVTNKHEPDEGEVLGENEEFTNGQGTDNPATGDTILPFALLLLTSLGGISITAKKIVDRQK